MPSSMGKARGILSLNDVFRRFAQNASIVLGTVWAFLLAVAVILVWALLGPAAGFSETWQLIINTGTTIVTFLMVFIIQNTQNRDNRAIHLKLDELVKAAHEARNDLIDIEGAPEEELAEFQREFAAERENNGHGGHTESSSGSTSSATGTKTRTGSAG